MYDVYSKRVYYYTAVPTCSDNLGGRPLLLTCVKELPSLFPFRGDYILLDSKIKDDR